MDLQTEGKEKAPISRYQQFLSDEDRRTWEYQQITKTGEEMHVERREKGKIISNSNPFK